MEDIWSYFKDGNSIDDIADEFGLEYDDVARVIRRMKSSGDNNNIEKEFGLNKKHRGENIGIDPTKRSDTIDYEYNPDYEENAVKGRVSATDIENKMKKRRKYKKPKGEVE